MIHGECQGCFRTSWLNKDYLCGKCELIRSSAVEQLPHKEKVESSSLSGSTIRYSNKE